MASKKDRLKKGWPHTLDRTQSHGPTYLQGGWDDRDLDISNVSRKRRSRNL